MSLDPRPLHVRARPLQAVVRDHPEALVGSTLLCTTNNNNTRQYCAMRQAKVVAYMPEDKRHVLVALVDAVPYRDAFVAKVNDDFEDFKVMARAHRAHCVRN